MKFSLVSGLLSTPSSRIVAKFGKRVATINALEAEMVDLRGEQLASWTIALRSKLADGASTDDILPQAFAVAREAARRALGLRAYDVQLIGAMTLHSARIAEMATGEGKTLVAAIAAYLEALTGKGVHIVTVNPYLARRDAEIMGQIHRALGLTVGLIVPDMSDDERRAAYAADITYATASELAFDRMKDELKFARQEMVQRAPNYAIVDEVDSILIDEARMPMIISAPADAPTSLCAQIDGVVLQIAQDGGDLWVKADMETRTATLTDAGLSAVEATLVRNGLLEEDTHLWDALNTRVAHHLNQALLATFVFRKDRDYMVRDGEILIIDAFSGRALPGRRFNDGLHQAIEAKERVEIRPENETVASITHQSFFRSYARLAGMTGTAATEAEEFKQIYGLEVVSIPTNRPLARRDENDEVYRTHAEKLGAIIREIETAHERRQPVLVGTTSIKHSEEIADLLVERGYDWREAGETEPREKAFAVLNARVHDQEAAIIALAGMPGAITIATNMAGRGTDIQLGGSLEADMTPFDAAKLANVTGAVDDLKARIAAGREIVEAAGGLYVIGTERHESRRIDNQLRGRAGRQGDVGRSRFFLSLEDDLLKIFGGVEKLMDQIPMAAGEAIAHPIIDRAVEKAQKRIEGRNFDARRDVVKYDQTIAGHRTATLTERNDLLDATDEEVVETLRSLHDMRINALIDAHIPENTYPEQWDVAGLTNAIQGATGVIFPIADLAKEEGVGVEEARERIIAGVQRYYGFVSDHNAPLGGAIVNRRLMLMILDAAWREHLADLGHLKNSIGLRAIGSRDPLVEFRTDAAELYEAMIARWAELVTYETMRMKLSPPVTAAA